MLELLKRCEGEAPSLTIGGVALVLVLWAVGDLVWARDDAPTTLAAAPAEEPAPADAVDLHRLLPDATDDLGRLVRVDGTIVAAVSGHGFWVRDLRDYVVFVATDEPHALGLRLRPGAAVRVTGIVALTAADRRPPAPRLRTDVAAVMVVEDVKIQTSETAVEVLGD